MSLCPKCGGKTVRRVNRKTGEDFIGCSMFPKCTFACDTKERRERKQINMEAWAWSANYGDDFQSHKGGA